MTPDDGEAIPRPTDPAASASTPTAPVRAPSGLRRFLARWGFPLFVVVVLVLGRGVLLPFVFAGLIAYILAPVVRWMSERRNGTRRMPRGVAIITCYIVFLAAVTGFMFLLVPRLSSDVARLGRQAPGFYTRINTEWTPEVARWLEKKFPTLAVAPPVPEDQKVVAEVPMPPDTAFTMTPLPDGSFAVGLAHGGVDIKPAADGGYRVVPLETAPPPVTLEDKLREYTRRTLVGLQSEVNDVLRAGQEFVADFIRGIFLFFFTLMIGAFMLIDLEKVQGFLRSLFPANVREDFDVIIAGIDQGLSGVIRGQLVICVVNSVFTYIGLLVFGIKYGLILAVVAGLMSLIPIFGSILSSVPIVLVALVSGGDSGIDIFRGLGMLLWIIGIHFVEANLLNPKIIGTAAKIHPVLVLFALFFGEASYGLVGALLAVPILSAVQVVFMYFYRKTWKDAGRTGPVRRVDATTPAP